MFRRLLEEVLPESRGRRGYVRVLDPVHKEPPEEHREEAAELKGVHVGFPLRDDDPSC